LRSQLSQYFRHRSPSSSGIARCPASTSTRLSSPTRSSSTSSGRGSTGIDEVIHGKRREILDIVGRPDTLIHDDFGVDWRLVWQLVDRDLRAIATTVDGLLGDRRSGDLPWRS